MLEPVRGPKFPMGRMFITPGAKSVLDEVDVMRALRRHQGGDWGGVCPEDRGANNQSLQDGSRLLSVYHSSNGIRFWVITEADRSSTTVLLPHEY